MVALGGVFSMGQIACTPWGASDVNYAQANEREQQGAELYGRQCAGCHGPRGEGLASFPAVMGPGALRRYASQSSGTLTPSRQRPQGAPGVNWDRRQFVTADDVYDYVANHRRWVSHCCHELLSNDEYWEVVTYMLVAHGSDVPPDGLNPSNAKTVPIKPKSAK